MKTKTHEIVFKTLPKKFEALCKYHMPRPIHDQIELDNTTAIADEMAGYESEMTKDQNDYFELLCNNIEKYEDEHVPGFKEVSGLEMLKHLLEMHQMNASDLSRLFGADRTLGAKILRGERNLTAAHLKILGERFSVQADLFL